jgi:GT2 family glycosyltransferase
MQRKHFLDPSRALRPYAISGCCWMFRADVLESVGGFDEYTFLYEEEFIMSERLGRLGWNVAVALGAEFAHTEAVATRQIPNLRRLHFIRSEQYLLHHYYRWSAIVRACFLTVRLLELPLFFARNLLRDRSSA